MGHCDGKQNVSASLKTIRNIINTILQSQFDLGLSHEVKSGLYKALYLVDSVVFELDKDEA